MVQVTSVTDGKDVLISEDQTILDATLNAGINHMHACGGNARCSTCRISVEAGLAACLPRNEAEQKMAQKLRFPESIRLACQTHVNGAVSFRRAVADELDVEIIGRQFQDDTGTRLGKEQSLAILFTDIVNYTAFAEAYPVYDIVHVLNRYYHRMNEIINRHNGIISDVAGDGILALFGLEQTLNPVLDSIKAVRAMQFALDNFNNYLSTMYRSSFGIRAGIHYGEVIVGNFDTGSMRKIAAIGDNVNLASRIETANKALGTQLLLSRSAYDMVHEVCEVTNRYTVPLKGKSGEYELLEIA